MIEGIIGFGIGVLVVIHVLMPVGIRAFIRDNTEKTFTENIEGTTYYITITKEMPPSKLR